MSALPPKAEIAGWPRHVRFVPEADIGGYLAGAVAFMNSRLQGLERATRYLGVQSPGEVRRNAARHLAD